MPWRARPAARPISGAHKTLPLPSYVEVTSLESGKTILVRLERRGPMSELQPDRTVARRRRAARHCRRGRRPRCACAGSIRPNRSAPCCVAGQPARRGSKRPRALLDVLQAQARPAGGRSSRGQAAAPEAVARRGKPDGGPPSPRSRSLQEARRASPSPFPLSAPSRSRCPAPIRLHGRLQARRVVASAEPAPPPVTRQVGSGRPDRRLFSVRGQRARAVAAKLGGQVISPAGKLWRVRSSVRSPRRAEAEAALAKAKAAGYSDARIQRGD
jgi:rare lipoprotein A